MQKFQDYLNQQDNRVWRFIEYKSRQSGMSLAEAARRSLSRLQRLADSPTGHIAILTAFRGEHDLATNLRRNSALSLDLRQAGLGFVPVAGGYVEKMRDPTGRETGEEQRVEEHSFFVSSQIPPEEFKRAILDLVRKYEQESALVKYAGDPQAYLLSSEGNEEPVGQWSYNKLADYYTRLTKGPQSRQFTFEAAGDASLSTQRIVDELLKS